MDFFSLFNFIWKLDCFIKKKKKGNLIVTVRKIMGEGDAKSSKKKKL